MLKCISGKWAEQTAWKAFLQCFDGMSSFPVESKHHPGQISHPASIYALFLWNLLLSSLPSSSPWLSLWFWFYACTILLHPPISFTKSDRRQIVLPEKQREPVLKSTPLCHLSSLQTRQHYGLLFRFFCRTPSQAKLPRPLKYHRQVFFPPKFSA